MPLGKVLADAHHLLDEVAKDGRGRDAIACRVWKPGGLTVEWAMPWECALDGEQVVLEKLANAFRVQGSGKDEEEGNFASKFFYRIRDRFDLLNPGKDKSGNILQSILDDKQAVSLLAMEYLNSGAATVKTMDEARKIVEPLLDQCRPVIRDKEKPKTQWKRDTRLYADGAPAGALSRQQGDRTMSTTHTLRFSALDTWFFRESRPFNAIGGSELASIFPPSPRTLMGAVRGAIGDALNADWRDFHQKKWKYQLADGKCLSELIGYGDDIGPLTLAGPWLVHSDERLYPVPLCLLERSEGGRKKCIRLCIGPATHTPLGKVRLPELPPATLGPRRWSGCGLVGRVWPASWPAIYPRTMNCAAPPNFSPKNPDWASPVTIANVLLVMGCSIRPDTCVQKGGLMIEAEIQHLPADVNLADRLIRLGGEGRLAHLELRQGGGVLPPVPKANTDTRGLILVLLTPARLGEGREGWLPPGFVAAEENGARVWKGRIADVVLTLHAAVIGKTLREGGWNLAEHKPRDVVSLVPAGSCYYVTVEDDITDAIKKLHGAHISDEKKHEREFGRGQIACGLWNKDEY